MFFINFVQKEAYHKSLETFTNEINPLKFMKNDQILCNFMEMHIFDWTQTVL